MRRPTTKDALSLGQAGSSKRSEHSVRAGADVLLRVMPRADTETGVASLDGRERERERGGRGSAERAAAAVRAPTRRLPPAGYRTGAAPGDAFALPDPDLHVGRAAAGHPASRSAAERGDVSRADRRTAQLSGARGPRRRA